jgi:hypothetical protein
MSAEKRSVLPRIAPIITDKRSWIEVLCPDVALIEIMRDVRKLQDGGLLALAAQVDEEAARAGHFTDLAG